MWRRGARHSPGRASSEATTIPLRAGRFASMEGTGRFSRRLPAHSPGGGLLRWGASARALSSSVSCMPAGSGRRHWCSASRRRDPLWSDPTAPLGSACAGGPVVGVPTGSLNWPDYVRRRRVNWRLLAWLCGLRPPPYRRSLGCGWSALPYWCSQASASSSDRTTIRRTGAAAKSTCKAHRRRPSGCIGGSTGADRHAHVGGRAPCRWVVAPRHAGQ